MLSEEDVKKLEAGDKWEAIIATLFPSNADRRSYKEELKVIALGRFDLKLSSNIAVLCRDTKAVGPWAYVIITDCSGEKDVDDLDTVPLESIRVSKYTAIEGILDGLLSDHSSFIPDKIEYGFRGAISLPLTNLSFSDKGLHKPIVKLINHLRVNITQQILGVNNYPWLI